MELEIDGWIQQLSQCKQLTEADVKKLCDKVRRPVSLPSSITARLLFPSVFIASPAVVMVYRQERF
jgi:hypothetical protein